MLRLVVVSTTNTETVTKDSEESVLSYLSKVHESSKDKSHRDTPLFKVVVTDAQLQKVKTVYPKKDWASLSEYCNVFANDEAQSCGYEENSSEKEIVLADLLHEVADSLPYTGVILNAVMLDNFSPSSTTEDGDTDHLVPLAGAVRRLTEWHNATMNLVCDAPGIPADREILVDLGGCQVVQSMEEMRFGVPNWVGKIAVMDRIEDKGHIFTGHSIQSDRWEALLQDKHQAVPQISVKPKQIGRKRPRQTTVKPLHVTRPVCGRTIEVLQEVDLRTLPFFMLDSWTFNLNVQEGHSDTLLKYVQDLKGIGLLARLRVYPDVTAIPRCGCTNSLNTGAWKRSVLGNSCREPQEKAIADDVFFMHFLLLAPDPDEDPSCITARVLLSPREVNRQVVHLMEEQGQRSEVKVDLTGTDAGDNLRVINRGDKFLRLIKLLEEHRKFVQVQIAKFTCGENKTQVKKIESEIKEHASQIEDRIINLAFKAYPTLTEYLQQDDDTSVASKKLHWIRESEMDPSQFPEKMAFQAKLAKRTQLQSYSSMESLPGSSPPIAGELEKAKRTGTSDFTIDDVLRMFKHGSPIKFPYKLEEVVGRQLYRVDSTPDLKTPWPDSQSIQYHDIYYYMDESDLGLEKKYSKVRDKLLEDTLSSFVSPVKKHKPQALRKVSPVRSSPRKRNSAQYLMTRSRSDSNHRSSSISEVFKQPTKPGLKSPPSRRTSLYHNTPNSSLPSSQHRASLGSSTSRVSSTSSSTSSRSFQFTPGLSTGGRRTSGAGFSSTPLSANPTRTSPRKRVLTKSFSSANLGVPSGSSHSARSTSGKSQVDREESVSPFSDAGVVAASKKRSSLARSLTFDAGVRRSPRKTTLSSPKCAGIESPIASKKTPTRRPSPVLDLDESSCQSQSGAEPRKRSEKHTVKLKYAVKNVLEEKGVSEGDTMYSACFMNLFNVCKLLLQTLPSSINLTEEMNNVVQSQVQQIINLEKRRCGINL